MSMAKKGKYYPVMRQTQLGKPLGPSQPNSLIRVDKVMSEMNRRLYRQHKIYRCKVSISDTDATVNQEVWALAPTWWVLNALRKARAHFNEAMEDEVAQAGTGRYYDFRISMGAGAQAWDGLAGLYRNPQSGIDSYITEGEYVYSDVRCADDNDRTFALVGPSSLSQYNVFEEYDRMGQAVVDPADGVNLGGYTDLIESIDNENVSHITSAGDSPPYDADDFPNLKWVKVGHLLRSTNGSQTLSTGFFDAPLGMIWLPNHTVGTNLNLDLEVQKGDYKGLCAYDI
jgi:hypothetical protein